MIKGDESMKKSVGRLFEKSAICPLYTRKPVTYEVNGPKTALENKLDFVEWGEKWGSMQAHVQPSSLKGKVGE